MNAFKKYDIFVGRMELASIRDEDIVTLLCQRDQRGIEALYDKYANYIYGFIHDLVKEEGIAQIVLQDTFLKVWNKIESYNQSKGILLTWMVSIARNSSIDMIRSKNYKQTLRLVSLENIPHEKGFSPNKTIVDIMDVRDNVAKLDKKPREILELVYFEGYTMSEVSKELGIPLGTVKSRVRKGFKDLRAIINH